MRPTVFLSAIAGAVLLCGCQASADDPLPASNGAPVADPGPAAVAAGDGRIFVQTLPKADYPTPDTNVRGRFAVDNGCLSFVAGGATFRAVLPAGTRFEAPSSVRFPDGRRIALASEIVVKGGEGEFGAAASIPANCPSKAILIGGLE